MERGRVRTCEGRGSAPVHGVQRSFDPNGKRVERQNFVDMRTSNCAAPFLSYGQNCCLVDYQDDSDSVEERVEDADDSDSIGRKRNAAAFEVTNISDEDLEGERELSSHYSPDFHAEKEDGSCMINFSTANSNVIGLTSPDTGNKSDNFREACSKSIYSPCKKVKVQGMDKCQSLCNASNSIVRRMDEGCSSAAAESRSYAWEDSWNEMGWCQDDDHSEEASNFSDYDYDEENGFTREGTKDAENLLVEMGFNSEHVACAIKACGKECSVFVLADFIEAHYCSHKEHEISNANAGNVHLKGDGAGNTLAIEENSKLSVIGKCTVEVGDDTTACMVDAEAQLLEMGFPPGHVEHAIAACGNESSVFVLSDFIQAHYSNQGEENLSENAKEDDIESSEDADWDRSHAVASTFKKLQQMGFRPDTVQKAAEVCGSDKFDELLEYLVDGVKDKFELIAGVGDRLEPVGATVKLEPLEYERNCVSSEASPFCDLDIRRKQSKRIQGQTYWSAYKVLKNITTSTSSSSENEDGCTTAVLNKKTTGIKVKIGRTYIAKKQIEEELPPACVHHGKMKGFGIPGSPLLKRPTQLDSLMLGPPYFYFENVATMPKSQWDTIKRHFNGVDPEFVDSKYFSASMRPRGYVHNLPIEGRKQILPTPPMTIDQALPQTVRYWPIWDTRCKLNCINTRRATASLCNEIRNRIAKHEGKSLPLHEQKFILYECKRWNLVWVGPAQVAPLEPHEIEFLLGFDKDHTRGSSTATERYIGLGNSFQINTVAYHLSVLKPLYPQGMNVLSLFSGIGGAEVTLDKLGIFLKNVVIVEIDPKARNVITSWWKKTKQKGQLISKDDVRKLTHDVLAKLSHQVGGFDLIIGGSPCNNVSGNNRVTRVGLEGKDSSAFYEFPRVLNIVKQIMQGRANR